MDDGLDGLDCPETGRPDGAGEAAVVRWVIGTPAHEQDPRPFFPGFADYALTELAEAEDW